MIKPTEAIASDRANFLLVDRLKQAIEADKPIHYDGQIVTTKAKPETSSIVFRRCTQLEQITKRIFPYPEAIGARLANYDPVYEFKGYPNHYPVQIIKGTGLALCENVFFSFPTGNRLEEQLGLECIDSWNSHYDRVIVPVVKEIFDRHSVELIFHSIDPSLLGIYVYWMSLVHEWGHSVGPYRIFPPTEGFLKLKPHLQGTFGETAANATAALLTPEHPEIALWILVFHIAFTGRKGFQANPDKGLINSDNDTASAVLLYQRLTQDGALEVTQDRKLHLHPDLLLPCYAKLRDDIDCLASEAFKLPEVECNKACDEWLKGQLPFEDEDEDDKFIFPKDLKRLYAGVQMLPEYPRHLPLLPFTI